MIFLKKLLLILLSNMVVTYSYAQTAKDLKAAHNGNLNAIVRVAGDYFRAGDYENALIWIKKGAQRGDAQANMMLSQCYAKGLGVTPNPKMSFSCIEKAMRKGEVDAYYVLANFYDLGFGVVKNPQKASELRKIAKDKKCNRNFRKMNNLPDHAKINMIYDPLQGTGPTSPYYFEIE
jgi:hypothetical protein